MKSAALLLATLSTAAALQTAPFHGPTPDERREIERKLTDLSSRLRALGTKKVDPALLADFDIYRRPPNTFSGFPRNSRAPRLWRIHGPSSTPDWAAPASSRPAPVVAATNGPRSSGLRVASRRQRATVRLDDPGILRRQQGDAARYLAARDRSLDERSCLHYPAAKGSARRCRPGLHTT
jgi:hypothetical protein